MMVDRILVCGLGSMGKRRIRILKSHFPKLELLGVDTSEERQKEVSDVFGITTANNFYTALKQFSPDAVLICSSPLTHADFVLHSLDNNIHTFSEINLTTDRYEKIINLAKKNNVVAFLSSTTLYKKEMDWIIQKVKHRTKINYRYHVGQYLPDWHPWESYSDFFVAKKETNALREIMAIEFPWILEAFGPVIDHKAINGKISKLDFGYPDTCHIMFRHESGTMGTLTIDCVSIKATRQLEVYSDDCYYQWKGLPDTLETYSTEKKKMIPILLYDETNSEDQYDAFIIENPYIEELYSFFEAIGDNSYVPKFGYKKDKDILQLIDNIEANQ